MKKLMRKVFLTLCLIVFFLSIVPVDVAENLGVIIQAQAAPYSYTKQVAVGPNADITRITADILDNGTEEDILDLGQVILGESNGVLTAKFTYTPISSRNIEVNFRITNLTTGGVNARSNAEVGKNYVELPQNLQVAFNNGQLVDSLELYIKISVRNDNGDMIEVASHSEEIHGIGYSNFSSNNMQSSSKSSKKIKKNTEQSKQLQTPDNNYGMFQQSVINTIDNTLSQLQTTSNTVNTIKIDTGVWISLKNDVYMKLQESGLPIEISFIYKGERYRIDIPAGSDLMSLVDENGYCGFLNLMAHFGGTKL